MSTMTKERAAQIAAGGGFNFDEIAVLARIALASLEAEPVCEVVLGMYDDCGCHPDARVACIAADGQADWENFKDGTRLYTAPPAPVSVPAAMEMDDDFDSAFEHGKAVGWNAYRDAMLKHSEPFIVTSDHRMMEMPQVEAINAVTAMLQGVEPVTTAYKLQDGWVACSERMPEIGIKVLCFPVNDEPIHATYNGQVWLQDISWSASDEPIDNVISCNVFHWMPLPAAPQQEA
ncbi:DUF551 domain-containing protein [Enterobacter hormaechei]|uniref:DUF551 domain-containing protein n=1 Tax=Enterobacter hormaechei TaxID=158836 RepID=UPI000735BDA0|nr:DUF551 domain-containing protein [Enterobacter hormaechei]KTG84663.1 hypothetical protein ASV36_22715 [Enterobacter hormaechei subsp. steigerwaltii]KVJ94463.1 hypothetical protein AWS21_22250 [Enterobacter hormaechei subsp. steigerwaltii]KVK03482.1 hypothetical protein AWS22_06005 [Enterobacter hormaechei subsp. steigerwaltii]